MPRENLSMLQSAQLLNHIEKHYTESACSDEHFAELATKALGFPVGRRHVNTRRDALKIPPYREVRAGALPPDLSNLQLRLDQQLRDSAALVAQFEQLAARVDTIVRVLNLQKHFYSGEGVKNV